MAQAADDDDDSISTDSGSEYLDEYAKFALKDKKIDAKDLDFDPSLVHEEEAEEEDDKEEEGWEESSVGSASTLSEGPVPFPEDPRPRRRRINRDDEGFINSDSDVSDGELTESESDASEPDLSSESDSDRRQPVLESDSDDQNDSDDDQNDKPIVIRRSRGGRQIKPPARIEYANSQIRDRRARVESHFDTSTDEETEADDEPVVKSESPPKKSPKSEKVSKKVTFSPQDQESQKSSQEEEEEDQVSVDSGVGTKDQDEVEDRAAAGKKRSAPTGDAPGPSPRATRGGKKQKKVSQPQRSSRNGSKSRSSSSAPKTLPTTKIEMVDDDNDLLPPKRKSRGGRPSTPVKVKQEEESAPKATRSNTKIDSNNRAVPTPRVSRRLKKSMTPNKIRVKLF